MLTSSDYKAAIDVQDACNLSGVVYSWREALGRIWKEADERGEGTDWVNRHPINVMYASKVASLTGCETGSTFSSAYAMCTQLSKEENHVATT